MLASPVSWAVTSSLPEVRETEVSVNDKWEEWQKTWNNPKQGTETKLQSDIYQILGGIMNGMSDKRPYFCNINGIPQSKGKRESDMEIFVSGILWGNGEQEYVYRQRKQWS